MNALLLIIDWLWPVPTLINWSLACSTPYWLLPSLYRSWPSWSRLRGGARSPPPVPRWCPLCGCSPHVHAGLSGLKHRHPAACRPCGHLPQWRQLPARLQSAKPSGNNIQTWPLWWESHLDILVHSIQLVKYSTYNIHNHFPHNLVTALSLAKSDM